MNKSGREDILTHMDDFCIHLGPTPRQFPHILPVQSIGYLSRKDGWVHATFGSFNFSFILKGSGEYWRDGKMWRVEAPCVITQWPDVKLDYGPDGEWEELYLIYDRGKIDELRNRRFADWEKPVWYIRDSAATRRKIAELRELLKEENAFGRADEIDRACESMVLESLIAETRSQKNPQEETIQAIQAYVNENYVYPIDFDELALEYRMSPASFRRHWGKIVGLPPARYMTQLRIRQACRMLVETSEAIGEVAGQVGFDDPLYFSRKFREVMGETASDYRKNHLSPLSLSEAD